MSFHSGKMVYAFQIYMYSAYKSNNLILYYI